MGLRQQKEAVWQGSEGMKTSEEGPGAWELALSHPQISGAVNFRQGKRTARLRLWVWSEKGSHTLATQALPCLGPSTGHWSPAED